MQWNWFFVFCFIWEANLCSLIIPAQHYTLQHTIQYNFRDQFKCVHNKFNVFLGRNWIKRLCATIFSFHSITKQQAFIGLESKIKKCSVCKYYVDNFRFQKIQIYGIYEYQDYHPFP